jgi:hypothetical protein
MPKAPSWQCCHSSRSRRSAVNVARLAFVPGSLERQIFVTLLSFRYDDIQFVSELTKLQSELSARTDAACAEQCVKRRIVWDRSHVTVISTHALQVEELG